MVILGFTHLKDAILSGAKQCTIRKMRKRAWKTTDLLNLYWHVRRPDCEHLFDVPLKQVTVLFFKDFTEAIAKQDGFTSLQEMQFWFITTHAKYMMEGDPTLNDARNWVQRIENTPFEWIQWDFTERLQAKPAKVQGVITDYIGNEKEEID
jgi:uncharacterized protein YqfB (UPF0267 family)